MGNRLSQIATRTGDDGTTGLGDGSRTDKDSLRIAALGDVDELNSTVGLLLTEDLPEDVRAALAGIQHDLFDLGGELCIPGWEKVTEAQVARLDALLAQHNAALPRLAEFILPGGSRAAALAHLARTVCRRAERTDAAPAQGRAQHVGDLDAPQRRHQRATQRDQVQHGQRTGALFVEQPGGGDRAVHHDRAHRRPSSRHCRISPGVAVRPALKARICAATAAADGACAAGSMGDRRATGRPWRVMT